ncbi:MAG: hypothetical protein ACYC0Q_01355 [Eubacteriales bacterium]
MFEQYMPQMWTGLFIFSFIAILSAICSPAISKEMSEVEEMSCGHQAHH